MTMIPTIAYLMSCHIPISNWNDFPDIVDKLRGEHKDVEDVDQFNELKITQVENGEGKERQDSINRHERRKQRAQERAKQKKHGQ